MAKIERVVIPAVVQVVEPEKEVFKLELDRGELSHIYAVLEHVRSSGIPRCSLQSVIYDMLVPPM